MDPAEVSFHPANCIVRTHNQPVHSMKPIDRTQLIGQLNWRYATKQYDRTRKINAADWATLEEALVLSPSSLGLQPWAFLVVDDPAVRAELMLASYGQPQI